MEKLLVKAKDSKPMKIGCNFIGHLFKDAPATAAFFYKQVHNSQFLIESLEKALTIFPVFAGRPITINGRAHIDCNNKGIFVEVKHSKETMENALKKFSQKASSNYFVRLLKTKNAPLLNIRFTYYSDGTMAIGVCWHHSVGDMTTFMLFMKCWSDSAAKQSPKEPLIVKDRRRYMHEKLVPSYKAPMNMKKTSFVDLAKLSFELIKHVFTRKVLYFHFDRDEIQKMKKAYFKVCGKQLLANDAICAHIMDFLGKYAPTKIGKRSLMMAIDFRKCMQLPAELIGNFISMISFEFSFAESPGLLAGKIRETVDLFPSLYFDYFASEKFLEENGGYFPGLIPHFISSQILHQGVLTINNLSRFGVYNINFGHSAPILFLPATLIPLPVAGFLVEGPKKNGMLFSLSLQRKIMNRLQQKDALTYIHRFRCPAKKSSDFSWLV